MKTEHVKYYFQTPFHVVSSTVKNNPGTWDSTKISIYREDRLHIEKRLIGEYIRNYSSCGPETFFPFMINGEWYALYSAEYTATRVMKLYEDHIEDWCGEEGSAGGFCPVEYYVPLFIESKNIFQMANQEPEEYISQLVDCDVSETEFLQELESPDFVRTSYTNFGFLCGCVWGDDSSWKIKYIDLSQIPDKVLIIKDKFGYFEMPSKLSLKECVDMNNWSLDENFIRLYKMENFNLDT